jgi:CRP-like cAMP-binding protein
MQMMARNLAAPSRVRNFNPGEKMSLQPNTFWLLKRGAVKTQTWDEEGTIVTLGYWGQNDIVGQPLSQVDPYQILCLTYVEATCIPAKHSSNLSEAIYRHIRQTQELLCIVRSDRMYQRLLRTLFWLSQKFGRQVETGQLIDLRLTHQELAEVTGATRVTITRLLNQFEQEGIITRPRRYAIVINPMFSPKLAFEF